MKIYKLRGKYVEDILQPSKFTNFSHNKDKKINFTTFAWLFAQFFYTTDIYK